MRMRSMLLLGWLVMAVPAAAQSPAEPSPRPVQAIEETIHVQAVNLEAVVTDARGRRVTGLTADDFRLKVDGVDTPITFFHPIEEGRGQIEEAAPSAEPVWQSRSILVFLDDSTMVKARRNIVVRSLVKQLDELAPGDQMAVVAFSGSGAKLSWGNSGPLSAPRDPGHPVRRALPALRRSPGTPAFSWRG